MSVSTEPSPAAKTRLEIDSPDQDQMTLLDTTGMLVAVSSQGCPDRGGSEATKISILVMPSGIQNPRSTVSLVTGFSMPVNTICVQVSPPIHRSISDPPKVSGSNRFAEATCASLSASAVALSFRVTYQTTRRFDSSRNR